MEYYLTLIAIFTLSFNSLACFLTGAYVSLDGEYTDCQWYQDSPMISALGSVNFVLLIALVIIAITI